MSHEQRSNREPKKKALKNLKEKRADKKHKHEEPKPGIGAVRSK